MASKKRAKEAAEKIKIKKRKKKDRKDFKGQKETPNPRMLKNIAEDIRKLKSLR